MCVCVCVCVCVCLYEYCIVKEKPYITKIENEKSTMPHHVFDVHDSLLNRNNRLNNRSIIDQDIFYTMHC